MTERRQTIVACLVLAFACTFGAAQAAAAVPGEITEFTTPTAQPSLFGVTAGPDGNIWFTENGTNRIGRALPSGEITEFSLPPAEEVLDPFSIVSGSDGNLWFTLANAIGRITPNGEHTAEFPANSPFVITSGPDGALWFTESRQGAIGRVSTS